MAVTPWGRADLIATDGAGSLAIRAVQGIPDGGHDADFPASNTAAVVTVPAPAAGKTGILTTIVAAYGSATIPTTVHELTVGANSLPVIDRLTLHMGLEGIVFSAETTVTLPAGGAGVTGALAVSWRYV